MATVLVSSNIAGNVKPAFASSSAVGLTVRSNGEERISVLDVAGNIVDAQIPAGATPPVLSQKRIIVITTVNAQAAFVVTSGALSSADVGKPIVGTNIPGNSTIATVTDATHGILSANATAGGAGISAVLGDTNTGLLQNQFAGYVYVYAATTRYPFVENDISVNGSLAPRGNPSPYATIQTDGSGTGINISVPQSTRADIDSIWIFRTEFFTALVDAQNNAAAGNAFFVGSIKNDPTQNGANVWFGDHIPISTGDQVEVDNFGVPIFQFIIYQDPYWWGWGNMPFTSTASWATNGIVTITDAAKKWFDGRNGQFIRLSGVGAGGGDGLGGFYFKWLTNTTAQLCTTPDLLTNAAFGSPGQGTVVVQGPSCTLYRSKARNPFSWGFTQYLGNNIRVPQVYAFKVGGGQGTAIGIVPAINYLYISTEYPAGSFVLDLSKAGSANFESSLKLLSTFYSITSHFSIFSATKNFTMIRELPDERVVLWGWDAKNYAILECDGFKINPISQKISNTLRNLSQDRSRQILAHGAYDARNKLNCMWLPTANSGMLCNYLIAQHGPTGEWFMNDEHDVLCSAQFQDAEQAVNKIFIGTQSGLVGEAFADNCYSEWQNNPYNAGTVSQGTANSIIRNDGGLFNVLDQGYVGSWCLVTDAQGNNEQWARISNVTQNSLTFDFIYSKIGGSTAGFNPVPQTGWLFYVGLIEVRALKYFDLGAPSTDKKLSEIWLTLENVDTQTGLLASTFIRFYEQLADIPDSPSHDGATLIQVVQPALLDNAKSISWRTRTPPSQRLKIFGIEIIDRGFLKWRMYNYTLKMEV